MMRHLLGPVALALVLPGGAAAFYPCPPCPVVVYPPGCLPGAVPPAPAGPTVVPERMDTPKKSPTEIPAKAEEFARPKAADPKTEGVVKPTTEDRIPPQNVPPRPTAPDLPQMDIDVPPLGGTPKPKDKPKDPPGTLPPIDFGDLPKLDGGAAQPVEANKPSESKSSPLTDRAATVDVFPREATGAGGAKRGVTFVNKSARDVLLTVGGQTTTLPSKHVLKVDLPAAFTWQMGGEAERTERVPDGSPGIDVVIRK